MPATLGEYKATLEEINGGEKLPGDVLLRWFRMGKEFNMDADAMGLEWEAYAMKLHNPDILDAEQIADFKRLVLARMKNKGERAGVPATPGSATLRAQMSSQSASWAKDFSSYGDVRVNLSARKPAQAGGFAVPEKRTAAGQAGMAGETPRRSTKREMSTPGSGSYAKRANHGQIQATYNDKIPMCTAYTKANDPADVEIQTLSPPGGIMEVLQKRRESEPRFQHRFMRENFRARTNVANQRIMQLAKVLKTKACGGAAPAAGQSGSMEVDEKAIEQDDDEEEFSPVDGAHQGSGWHCGRIVCEGEGRLNAASLLLEGDLDTSGGRRAKLNLQALPGYAVFPNQVVVVKGKNDSGQMIMAEELYTNAALPKDTSPPLPQPDTLQVMVAVGPFTVASRLCFEASAFKDLANQCNERKVDVIILIGPFVDEKNKMVSGDLCDQTYQEYADNLIYEFRQAVQEGGKSPHIYILPSPTDVSHDCVFPQQPFPVPDDANVKYVPNPCQLKIGSFTFGVSSNDIIFATSLQTCLKKAQGDGRSRVLKVANHCIHQQHFYPLYPTHKDAPLLDYNFSADLQFMHTPDILILPSRLKAFADEGDEHVVCINPGPLTKGESGGTYALLTLKRPPPSNVHRHDFVRADIIRI